MSVRLLIFKSILVSLLLMSFKSSAFDFQLDGWKEFKFGSEWADAKEQLQKRCAYQEALSGDIFGYDCVQWLYLDVDVRIIADEGKFLGFGKKLRTIIISTQFSDSAGNTILAHLRKHFELTRDYKCWHKTQDGHNCSIIFKNGAVIFNDDKYRFTEKRTLSVELMPYELYEPGTFN